MIKFLMPAWLLFPVAFVGAQPISSNQTPPRELLDSAHAPRGVDDEPALNAGSALTLYARGERRAQLELDWARVFLVSILVGIAGVITSGILELTDSVPEVVSVPLGLFTASMIPAGLTVAVVLVGFRM